MSEGPECQMAQTAKRATSEAPKLKYNLVFHNTEGEQIGVLDFNGPGLAFEGNAELSAIVFMDWIGKSFKSRLDEEYARGLKDGKAFTREQSKS